MTLRGFISVLIAAAAVTVSAKANGLEKVVFIPQWTAQAQFAGYYIAKDKGFYEEEGLDVEFSHCEYASVHSTAENLVNGKAHIAGLQLLSAMTAKGEGYDIVNVMQVLQRSALWCVCSSPVSTPADLNGKKVGILRFTFKENSAMVESSMGIKPDWIQYINGINLFVYNAVDAIFCQSYNEYIRLKQAVGMVPEDNVLKFSEYGYDCPEDGLYATREYCLKHGATIEKFKKATARGWEYARNHRDEALEISLKYIKTGNVITNEILEKEQLDEILRLQEDDNGQYFTPVRESTFNTLKTMMQESGLLKYDFNYSDFIR